MIFPHSQSLRAYDLQLSIRTKRRPVKSSRDPLAQIGDAECLGTYGFPSKARIDSCSAQETCITGRIVLVHCVAVGGIAAYTRPITTQLFCSRRGSPRPECYLLVGKIHVAKQQCSPSRRETRARSPIRAWTRSCTLILTRCINDYRQSGHVADGDSAILRHSVNRIYIAQHLVPPQSSSGPQA